MLLFVAGPSLMTAGIKATFRVLMRDEFANVQYKTSQVVAGEIKCSHFNRF